MLKTLLFDLDGTLLPMDMDAFTKKYLGTLAAVMKPQGFEDSHKLIGAIWAGMKAMQENDGSRLNEEVFWNAMNAAYGKDLRPSIPAFENFYRHEFHSVKDTCPANPAVKQLVEDAKAKGYRLILATNPIFPRIATEGRIGWAGLDPDDFDYITTYENSSFSKPNPEYFRDLLDALHLDPAECLMIGNDTTEDAACLEAGLPFFLLTDTMLNPENKPVDSFEHGSLPELKDRLGL